MACFCREKGFPGSLEPGIHPNAISIVFPLSFLPFSPYLTAGIGANLAAFTYSGRPASDTAWKLLITKEYLFVGPGLILRMGAELNRVCPLLGTMKHRRKLAKQDREGEIES